MACDFCIRPNDRVAYDRAGFNMRTGADHRVDDRCATIDQGVGVHEWSKLKLAVRAQVGVAIAEVEPYAIIERDGAELILLGEFEKEGDYRNFFMRWDLADEFRVHAIDAAEDMGACGAAEFFMNVDDSASRCVERNVSGLAV